jgi:hypothetical protein
MSLSIRNSLTNIKLVQGKGQIIVFVPQALQRHWVLLCHATCQPFSTGYTTTTTAPKRRFIASRVRNVGHPCYYPHFLFLLFLVLLTFLHEDSDDDQMTKRGASSDSSPRHSPSLEVEQAWMDKENAACTSRDERLKKRFRLLLQQFWNGMGQTIPFAYQGWAKGWVASCCPPVMSRTMPGCSGNAQSDRHTDLTQSTCDQGNGADSVTTKGCAAIWIRCRRWWRKRAAYVSPQIFQGA